ncbi:MAG: hypothetical protein ACRDN0_04390 [Trebonia sp.]
MKLHLMQSHHPERTATATITGTASALTAVAQSDTDGVTGARAHWPAE